MSNFFQSSDLLDQRKKARKSYLEFLRFPSMSAGLYVLAVGATDPQKPHNQDELYYVIRGRARMKAGDEDKEISPGSVVFVAARAEHRFYEIEEELAALVFFAPAESA